MLNLIQSNLYRLVRSKMVYVALAIIALYFGMTAYSNYQSSQPADIAQMRLDLVQMRSEGEDAESIAQTEHMIRAFETRTLDGGFTGADMVGVVPGGLLSIILCVLAALFCHQDFSTGFVKNQLSALTGHRVTGERPPIGRGAYYAGTLMTIAIMNAVFLIVTVTLGIASQVLLGFTVRDPEPAWQIAAWMFLTWLILCGYTFFVAAIAWGERNQAVGAVGALLVGSQGLETIIQLVLSTGAQLVPGTGIAAALEAISAWLPTVSTNILLGGASALFGGTTGGFWEATLQVLSTMAHPLAHVVVTTCGFLALGLAIVFLGCRRQDIA